MTFPLNGGTDYTHRSFADDTKLGEEVDRPDSCAAIQKDPDRLEKWSDGNLMKQKKVLHLQRGCSRWSPEVLASLKNFLILWFI